MDDQPILINLQSVTIFWEDIAQISPMPRTELVDTINHWLSENTNGSYSLHQAGVWFANPQDAMLFKLTWSGRDET